MSADPGTEPLAGDQRWHGARAKSLMREAEQALAQAHRLMARNGQHDVAEDAAALATRIGLLRRKVQL